MSLRDLYKTDTGAKKPEVKKPKKTTSTDDLGLGITAISDDVAAFWTKQGCGKPC
jgi:hypothetical protein